MSVASRDVHQAAPGMGLFLFDGSSLPGGGLASHQLDALQWLDDRPVALLADPTGSGKTAVACALMGHAFQVEGATRDMWVTEAHRTRRRCGSYAAFSLSCRAAPGLTDETKRWRSSPTTCSAGGWSS